MRILYFFTKPLEQNTSKLSQILVLTNKNTWENGKIMTQEQKINRGTIIIFILSIVLVLTLCGAATLAYFAGKQDANVTLIMGGPVRVSMVNNNF